MKQDLISIFIIKMEIITKEWEKIYNPERTQTSIVWLPCFWSSPAPWFPLYYFAAKKVLKMEILILRRKALTSLKKKRQQIFGKLCV